MRLLLAMDRGKAYYYGRWYYHLPGISGCIMQERRISKNRAPGLNANP
jgi:hypothetical protein